ncbi:sulfate transporter CysZ [Salinibius halmophilus]|uniref:sulfate transporter CysZ n=1 Tax=Salinibius halmophilus TaxID=1853216 RepID=UPI000E6628FB|nr:sulfate transporter CysZ [Salinibius halmophilus]
MTNLQHAASGPVLWLRGLKIALTPAYLPFIAIPLLINVLTLGMGSIWSWRVLNRLWETFVVSWLAEYLPSWALTIIDALGILAAIVIILPVLYLAFGWLASFLCSPFNGFLAEKITQSRRGFINPVTWNLAELWALTVRTLMRELRRLSYWLPRALLIWLVGWVPGMQIFMPLIWFVFASWMAALTFIDYAADNDGLTFDQTRAQLATQRWQALSFGAVAVVCAMVPVMNFLFIPITVAGGTLFWIERLAPQKTNYA